VLRERQREGRQREMGERWGGGERGGERVRDRDREMEGREREGRLYKSLIKPIVSYGSVTWTLTQTTEQIKILRRIYGPIQEGGRWRPR